MKNGIDLGKAEQKLRERMQVLLRQALHYCSLPSTDDYRQEQANEAAFGAWLASALMLTRALIPDSNVAHRVAIERLAAPNAAGDLQSNVRKVWHLLGNFDEDLGHGLFNTIADRAIALTLDNFLVHAEQLLRANQVDVAGVLAGVAYEDAMRKYANTIQLPADLSIEDVIVSLTKSGVLSKIDASRARTAAAVRTSATHAKWEEFNKGSVEACISFTREILTRYS